MFALSPNLPKLPSEILEQIPLHLPGQDVAKMEVVQPLGQSQVEVRAKEGSPFLLGPHFAMVTYVSPHEVNYSECVCHWHSLQEVTQQLKVYRKCTRVGSDENETTNSLANAKQAHEQS